MLVPSANAALVQRRLLRQVGDAPGALAVITLATVASAVVTIGQMILAAQLIASAFAPAAPGATTRALAWLLGLVVLRAACTGVTELAAQRLATQTKSRLRRELVARVIAHGPRALAWEATGELVTTTMDGVEKLDAYYRRFFPQIVATAVTPLLVAAAVAWIDPLTAVVLALTGPLIPVFMWLLGTLAERRTRAQWEALGVLGARFLDTLQGLPTLTLFGRAHDAESTLRESSEQLRIRTMSVLRVAFLSGFVLELTASVSIAVVAATVGVRLIEGWLAFAPGLAALLLAPEFYSPFRQLGQRHHAAMEAVAAAERIFALLDAPGAQAAKPLHAAPEPVAFSATVVGERITYSYPDAEAAALKDVTFELRPRTMTAIVGSSGAGKSTLVGVLLRFNEPDGGRLWLNGRERDEMDTAAWRRQFALVPQRPRFFDGSILENLRVARPDASLEEVRDAARLAHAEGFITALPEAYDARLDESASTLSAGERQRLAIARALLKRAPVLVLDEPTSHLDAESEALVADALAGVASERTVVIVTHRLQAIRHADVIMVVEGGRVVESGTHASLRRHGRAYATLLRAHQEVA